MQITLKEESKGGTKQEAIAKQSAIVGATALTAALIPASSALIPALSSLAYQLAKSIKK